MDERRRLLESGRSIERVRFSDSTAFDAEWDWVSTYSAFRRRRTLIFGTFVLTFLCAAAGLYLQPERHKAHMKFLVKKSRVELPVTGESQAGTVIRESANDVDVNLEIELLTSRDVLRNVLKSNRNSKSFSGETEPQDIAKLARDLKIEQVKRSTVIEVTYGAGTSEQAIETLQHLATAYFEKHIEAHRSAGTYSFFMSESERSDKRLNDGLAALSAFQTANPAFVLLDQQKTLAVQRLSEAETEARSLRAQYQEAAIRVKELKAVQAETPERIVGQNRVLPNQYSIERLQTILVELKNRRTELGSRIQPGDRLLSDLDKQISDTSAALSQVSTSNVTEQSTDVNPARTHVNSDLVSGTVTLAGLAERVQMSTATVSGLRESLSGLEAATRTYQLLQREVGEAEKEASLVAAKKEEARISDALDGQRIMNTSLIEQPNDLAESTGLGRASQVGLAAFTAFLISMMVFVLVELGASAHRQLTMGALLDRHSDDAPLDDSKVRSIGEVPIAEEKLPA